MARNKTQDPKTLRSEIATPLFQLIRAVESAAIVAPSGMGKSRFVHLLLREDVQRLYLGDEATHTLFVQVDCNRLADYSEWGFYELLLTSLTESVGDLPDAESLRHTLTAWRSEVITQENALLARRYVELAVNMLCQERSHRLCLFLDEFDESLQSLPAPALNNLRALRDANKNQLCYILMVRDSPESLRLPDAYEGFYELLSRSILFLIPYTWKDAEQVLHNLENRRNHILSGEDRTQLIEQSGGHGGLLVALFDAFLHNRPQTATVKQDDWSKWATEQETVQEEFRKLWIGLNSDEQIALRQLAEGLLPSLTFRKSLLEKGLIQAVSDTAFDLFTPLFQTYIQIQSVPKQKRLWVDEQTAIVRVEGKRIDGLTSLEFELVRFLYRQRDQICTRDDILAKLYPNEQNYPGNNNRVDTLVGRVRAKIEPDPRHPHYLVTVRGRGYRLLDGS